MSANKDFEIVDNYSGLIGFGATSFPKEEEPVTKEEPKIIKKEAPRKNAPKTSISAGENMKYYHFRIPLTDEEYACLRLLTKDLSIPAFIRECIVKVLNSEDYIDALKLVKNYFKKK